MGLLFCFSAAPIFRHSAPIFRHSSRVFGGWEDDVRPRPRLDGRRDARLRVVAVDILHEDVGLHLFVVLDDLPAELGGALGNEVRPVQKAGNSTPVHTPGSPPADLR